jgi:hypothetical protein
VTPPRKPREFDDGMLLRQLRRRIPDVDDRTDDLLFELRSRLWYREYKLECHNRQRVEAEKVLGRIEKNVEHQTAKLVAFADALENGDPLPGDEAGRPQLHVVECDDDA